MEVPARQGSEAAVCPHCAHSSVGPGSGQGHGVPRLRCGHGALATLSRGQLQPGQLPCGIAPNRHLFSSYSHLAQARRRRSSFPTNWKYFKVTQNRHSALRLEQPDHTDEMNLLLETTFRCRETDIQRSKDIVSKIEHSGPRKGELRADTCPGRRERVPDHSAGWFRSIRTESARGRNRPHSCCRKGLCHPSSGRLPAVPRRLRGPGLVPPHG